MRFQALRRLVIRRGLDGLYGLRAHALFGRAARGRGVILMFHHVREPDGSSFRPNAHLEITPDYLRAVIRRVRTLGMDIVDLDEMAARLARPKEVRPFAVLTFDDGYRNNLTSAYPVLKSENAPFSVYVATGLVDGTAMPWWDVVAAIIARCDRIGIDIGGQLIERPTGSMDEKHRAFDAVIAALIRVPEDEQRRAVGVAAAAHGIDVARFVRDVMMDWGEIAALARDPLVTIGAHSVGHYALSRLDAARALSEMVESRARIAEMAGIMPRHFAYPYGSAETAGPREFDMAAELGFVTAVTTRRGVVTADYAAALDRLPRISVNGDYQQIRYLDLLVSGVPYAIERRINRIRGRASASASS